DRAGPDTARCILPRHPRSTRTQHPVRGVVLPRCRLIFELCPLPVPPRPAILMPTVQQQSHASGHIKSRITQAAHARWRRAGSNPEQESRMSHIHRARADIRERRGGPALFSLVALVGPIVLPTPAMTSAQARHSLPLILSSSAALGDPQELKRFLEH